MKLVPCTILDSLSVQLIKHINVNAFFCSNFQVGQLLNSHELIHEVTSNSLLVLHIFNVFVFPMV